MLDNTKIASLFTGQHPEPSIKHLLQKDTTWSNKKILPQNRQIYKKAIEKR
jgi:hypothetical protein